MKKLTILFILCTTPLFAQTKPLPDAPVPKGPAHSDPGKIKDPYWTDHRVDTKHFWGMVGGMGGSAYAHYKGGAICRQNNGVEPCTAHYGSFGATEISDGVISVGAGTAIYYLCRRDTHNSKWCDVIPSLVIGGNVGWGIHEARIHTPKDTWKE
jgi:hypothetical protein